MSLPELRKLHAEIIWQCLKRIVIEIQPLNGSMKD